MNYFEWINIHISGKNFFYFFIWKKLLLDSDISLIFLWPLLQECQIQVYSYLCWYLYQKKQNVIIYWEYTDF